MTDSRTGKIAHEAVLFSGDVLHHPLQLLEPKLCLPDEFESARALETRLSLIDRCVDAPPWLMTGHCIPPPEVASYDWASICSSVSSINSDLLLELVERVGVALETFKQHDWR